MLLTSSLEPAGLKSTKHYLVLHYDDRRNLVVLPKSYPDLERLVKDLYHLNPGTFYVETEELNLCKGKRIKIPNEFWGDVAELLGNIHVIPNNDNSSHSHPESTPSSNTQPDPESNANKGHIILNSPLVNNEVLLIKAGEIDTGAVFTASAVFEVQLVDVNHGIALAISIFQGRGLVTSSTDNATVAHQIKDVFTLAAEHHIIVRKAESQFLVVADSRIIAAIKAPIHLPITAVTYNLGTQSPFKGPISAVVFPSLHQLVQSFGQGISAVAALDGQALYHKILESNPGNATLVANALETIRKETSSFKQSGSGTKWHGRVIQHQAWAEFEWGVNPNSVFILHYNIQEGSRPTIVILFYGVDRYLLRLATSGEKGILFGEKTESGSWVDYQSFQLEHTILSPGEHNLAFVNHGGNVQVIFDFGKSVDISKKTMIQGKLKEVYLDMSANFPAGLDLFEFGQ